EDLAKQCRKVKVEDAEAVLVSLAGPGSGQMTPPVGPARPPQGSSPAPKITYRKPDNWKEHPDASGFAAASFRAGEGASAVDITAPPRPGAAGGRLANVQRWCRQIQREPITAAELEKELRPINIAGKPAQMIDLVGPEAGGQRQRIIGIIVTQGEYTWF